MVYSVYLGTPCIQYIIETQQIIVKWIMYWNWELWIPISSQGQSHHISGQGQFRWIGWEAGIGAPVPQTKAFKQQLQGNLWFTGQWPLSPPYNFNHKVFQVKNIQLLLIYSCNQVLSFTSSFHFSLFSREKPMELGLLIKWRHIIKLVFIFCLALHIPERGNGDFEVVH